MLGATKEFCETCGDPAHNKCAADGAWRCDRCLFAWQAEEPEQVLA